LVWLPRFLARAKKRLLIIHFTPFSPIFRQILAVSGLRDSGVDFGWQPFWPTYVPFLWIPIDHVLLSPEAQVHNRATGSFIGSGHYPVFAELSIQN
jgi:endonuclease/exonuclease/phosphatase (EEP) superfamily protein YafD